MAVAGKRPGYRHVGDGLITKGGGQVRGILAFNVGEQPRHRALHYPARILLSAYVVHESHARPSVARE